MTWYQVVDPAFARDYDRIWAGVSEAENLYIRKVWADGDTTDDGALVEDATG